MTYENTDKYGYFEVEAEVEEEGLFFQWRRYMGSVKVKKLGGLYASWCENGTIKFYRNDYMRARCYPNFVKTALAVSSSR